MVNNIQGVPESSRSQSENLSTNHNIIMGADSESEEDDAVLLGYEPLPLAPQEDDNESNDSEDDSGVDSGSQETPNENVPPITRIENELVRAVWEEPVSTISDIQMDSNKVNEVKQVMMNVTLPPSSIPEWANNIPEDKWKEHLINRLNNLQK